MTPGPTSVYECPICTKLITRGSIMSGNTIGSKLYSDGKSFAPMLPEYPNLTSCKNCQSIFWLKELEEIGNFTWRESENLEWKKADQAEFLTINEYFRAIETDIAEKDELYIRLRIWWSYNDRLRTGREIFMDEEDQLKWSENILKMMDLLDPTDLNEKIMLAEAHRNLGDFDACEKLILSIDNDELNEIKVKFIYQCKRKNKWVIQLNK